MILTRLLTTWTVSLLIATGSFAQPASGDKKSPTTKAAVIIDEFGRATDCDVGARVDNFFIQLHNNPDAVGYVITYAGRDLLPSQYDITPNLRRIRMNIASRRYDPARVVFISGGFRTSEATEFFLAPPGATPPKPTKTVAAPKPPNGTFQWSRYGLVDDDPYGRSRLALDSVRAKEIAEEEARLAEMEAEESEVDDEDGSHSEVFEGDGHMHGAQSDADRLDWFDQRFLLQVQNRKGASGVIIIYADTEYYDLGKLHSFVTEARDHALKGVKIHSEDIKIVFGGYRDYPQAEYWIVPKGGKAPKPTPEERPIVEEEEPL